MRKFLLLPLVCVVLVVGVPVNRNNETLASGVREIETIELAADDVDESRTLPLKQTGLTSVELLSSSVQLSICPAPVCSGLLLIDYDCTGNLEGKSQCQFSLNFLTRMTKFNGEASFKPPTTCIPATIGPDGRLLRAAVDGIVSPHEKFNPETAGGIHTTLNIQSLPTDCDITITNAIVSVPESTAAASIANFFVDYWIYLALGALAIGVAVLIIVLVVVVCRRKKRAKANPQPAPPQPQAVTPVVPVKPASVRVVSSEEAPPPPSRKRKSKAKTKTRRKEETEESEGSRKDEEKAPSRTEGDKEKEKESKPKGSKASKISKKEKSKTPPPPPDKSSAKNKSIASTDTEPMAAPAAKKTDKSRPASAPATPTTPAGVAKEAKEGKKRVVMARGPRLYRAETQSANEISFDFLEPVEISSSAPGAPPPFNDASVERGSGRSVRSGKSRNETDKSRSVAASAPSRPETDEGASKPETTGNKGKSVNANAPTPSKESGNGGKRKRSR